MAATTTNRSLTQYSGDTPSSLFIREVQDWMPMLKRTDTPLSKMIKRESPLAIPMLKSEWGWGSPAPDQDALTGALTNSQTNIPVANGGAWAVGDIAYIDTEAMRVISIAGNTLTVDTRPFGGTAVIHSSGATVFKMAPAIIENASTPLAPITQGEVDFNYFQQIEAAIQLSHRAKVTPNYETKNLIGDRDKQELRKKMEKELPVFFENSLLFGYRNLGSTTSPSSMGGIFNTPSFVTTSNTSLSGPLTENQLWSNLQTVYNQVGQDLMGHTLMAHPFVCRAISSWYNDSRRTGPADDKIKLNFTTIDSGWFGELTLIPNYKMVMSGVSGAVPLNKLVVFNVDDLAITPYSSDSGWAIYALPQDGWFTKAAIRGDFTLEAQNPDSRLILGGFSTADADYPGIA